MTAKGQSVRKTKELIGLEQLTNQYRQFYDLSRTRNIDSIGDDFQNLFISPTVSLFKDYLDDGNPPFSDIHEYLEDYSAFLVTNSLRIPEWRVINDSAVLYGKKGDNYYAWVHKTYAYTCEGVRDTVRHWVRLTMQRLSPGNFKITAVDPASRPEDKDADGIADPYDNCKNESIGINDTLTIDGCVKRPPPVIVSDPPATKNSPSDTIHKNPVIPKSPYPRQSLECRVGPIWSAGTSFARNEILDYNTNTFKDSGGLARSPGYMIDLSYHLKFNRIFDAGVGIRHIYLPFAEKKLMLQVRNYLGNHGTNYQYVAVSSNAYRMNLFYATLALITLGNDKRMFKWEVLFGQLRTDLVWKNYFELQVNEGPGQGTQIIRQSLEYPPFPVYGAKGTYQLKLKGQRLGLLVTAEYLWGKSHTASQLLRFDDEDGIFTTSAPDLQLLSLSAGIHYTLK